MARSVAKTNAMVTGGQEPALWPAVVGKVKGFISKDVQDLKVLLGSLPFPRQLEAVCVCTRVCRRAGAGQRRDRTGRAEQGQQQVILAGPGTAAGWEQQPSCCSHAVSFPVPFVPPRADLSPF